MQHFKAGQDENGLYGVYDTVSRVWNYMDEGLIHARAAQMNKEQSQYESKLAFQYGCSNDLYVRE